MEISVGKTINQAIEIIRKTYREIYRLKDDLVDLVNEYDPAMKFIDEYSYGGKFLHLKANHTFLLKSESLEGDDTEKEKMKKQRVLAVVCIFYDEEGMNRINLKDESELWVGLFDILNSKDNCRPWDISNLLRAEERSQFRNGELRIGGEVFSFLWEDSKTKEQWRGKFVGYPLADITDREKIGKSILNKLFA